MRWLSDACMTPTSSSGRFRSSAAACQAVVLTSVCMSMCSDKANTLHSVARVLPAWDKDMPEYGRIAGMLAFGLQENRLFDAATDAVRTSLDSDPSDVWART